MLRVRLIIKDLPILGPDSVESVIFALAAHVIGGEEPCQVVQDALFSADEIRMTGYYLEELAESAGLDPKP